MNIFLVLSHYPDGVSVWARSKREDAEKLACSLLEDELDGNTGEEIKTRRRSVIKEIKDLLFVGKFQEANDLWMETQRELEFDFIEGFEIRQGELDGESIESAEEKQ